MKILYAIQGTGNGHLSRAKEIIPLLQQRGEVDILVSGTQAEVELAYPIKYKAQGLGFVFGKKGGVDLLATYRNNKLKRLWREIKELPVEDYDVIISDFEPVSAWACYLEGRTCVGLSHQAAVLNEFAPRSRRTDMIGETILKNYAPATLYYGFHFASYDQNIYAPVIRSEVRQLRPVRGEHYTVYLPAYSDERIIRILSMFEDVHWEVFSKNSKTSYHEQNVTIVPIDNDAFLKSMASAEGVLCGAGFETPAEALFLKKKLMVIPMKGQYEQQCNASALKRMGVPVIRSLKEKHADKIEAWLNSGKVVAVNYPDETAYIIDKLLEQYPVNGKTEKIDEPVSSAKKFRKLIVRKMLSKLAL
jgi:uncharacterized protein (TIGR00661 family)